MTPRANIGTLTILSLPLRRKPFFALLCLIPLSAASGHAETPAPAKVALVSFGDPLAEAVAIALAAWNVSFERLDESSLTSIMPGTADAARILASQTGSDAVVWISESNSGPAIWVYDAASDKVSARRLPSSPPYDEPTAASVALSLKTLLRHSRFAPEKTPADGTRDKPKVELVAFPPKTEPRHPIVLGAGLGGRLRPSAPDELRLHLGFEVFISQRLHLGAALFIGLGSQIEDSEFSGELSSYQGSLEVGITALQRGPTAIRVAGGAGLTASRLQLTAPEARGVNRFNPSLDSRARLQFELGAGISLGLDVGGSALLRRQRYVSQGRDVFEMPRFEVGAGLLVHLTR